MEMFISFLVMFAIFTLLVHYYTNYKRPMGFQYEKVWAVNFSFPENTPQGDSNRIFFDALKRTVRMVPGVQEVSFCGFNLPFSMSTSNSNVDYGKHSVSTQMYVADDDYAAVLKLEMAEGRWFNKEDNAGNVKPAVINLSLKEKFFPDETAIGKVLANNRKIVGVVKDFKEKGDYQVADYALYDRMDTSYFLSNLLVKVRPDADAAAESRLFKVMSNVLKNSNVEIEHLSAKRVAKNKITLIPMIILLVVAGFLIINVALGLFGVLWYNINKRRGEIGLRRAVGASGNNVTAQLIGEALVLSTLSLILGSFFAVQFPLLHVFDLSTMVYITALFLSVIFIYLLVILCALYPGKQAAGIFPAVALHEE